MNRKLLLPILALFSVNTPAHADFQSFEMAFAEVCLQALPDLKQAISDFNAQGWIGYAGAGNGEFEYSKNGTVVFLTSGDIQDTRLQPGSTVMDEEVSLLEAQTSLERALGRYFEGRWRKGSNQWGHVWRLLVDTGTVVFTIQQDLSGNGGAVAFELRP